MKLSQLVKSSENAEELLGILRWQVSTLVRKDTPDWQLAGRLAVNLQRRGYPNAAKRVQMAASDEDPKALAAVLKDLMRDRGIFP
jgi:secreted Zn-dependent insulinase-like peptidase